jgi:small-conductance mechanosensitive channel
LKTLLHYTVLVAGFALALAIAGVGLSSVAIVIGALGVGIGFGLQNLVNNFASGLILLFERPVRPGDVVVVGGEWGTIRKIGLRSTVILTFDRAELIVPNGDLISEKVTNWTLSDRVARVVLPVGVAYGSDVEKVLRILFEVAESQPEVLEEPPAQALFRGFGESSLDFELRVWLGSIDLRLEVTSALCGALDARFREEGVEIPFPQRDLHLRSVEAEAVRRLGATSGAAPPEVED